MQKAEISTQNQTSMEMLFKEHYASMYRLAFTLLRDGEASRDVVQSVFLKLMSGSQILREPSVRGYLLMSVRNGCLNLMAHKKLDERLQMLYPREMEYSLAPVKEQEERWKAISSYIDEHLSPQTARILRLCYDEEKSYKEVAEELEISVSAVNKHIVQGLKELRKKFKNETDES
ncbi:MAG: sigma-70 family RNA polymerase sigma factor [Prevotella sp.]|jgi:RNA polymerase sigma factor (sigma-70 family)|nr:sigma-70 family RNA polymerase sigma factor [Prevotella sp.]MCI1281044.1 sigma-70 family RNA polymerase sigma factor [Prevotella sp.]